MIVRALLLFLAAECVVESGAVWGNAFGALDLDLDHDKDLELEGEAQLQAFGPASEAAPASVVAESLRLDLGETSDRSGADEEGPVQDLEHIAEKVRETFAHASERVAHAKQQVKQSAAWASKSVRRAFGGRAQSGRSAAAAAAAAEASIDRRGGHADDSEEYLEEAEREEGTASEVKAANENAAKDSGASAASSHDGKSKSEKLAKSKTQRKAQTQKNAETKAQESKRKVEAGTSKKAVVHEMTAESLNSSAPAAPAVASKTKATEQAKGWSEQSAGVAPEASGAKSTATGQANNAGAHAEVVPKTAGAKSTKAGSEASGAKSTATGQANNAGAHAEIVPKTADAKSAKAGDAKSAPAVQPARATESAAKTKSMNGATGSVAEAGVDSDIVFWRLCDADLHANLGNFGPDGGPSELRFRGVANVEDKVIDLVVTNATEFLTNDPMRNGKKECFGKVNVRHNSAVRLNFGFVVSGTNTPVVLKSFFLTMYDLEQSYDGSVVKSVAMSSDDGDFFVLPDTSVEVGALQLLEKEYVQFNGTIGGNGSDNPQTLATTSDMHLRKGIAFQFRNASGGTLLLQVFGGQQGRNFFFEGQTDTVYQRATTTTPTTTTTTTTTTTIATTTTATTSQTCTDDSCVVWGDPHILTFDVQRLRRERHPQREAFLRTHGWQDDQVSVHKAGTYWLVRSARVHIQASYEHPPGQPNVTALSVLAVGGPFLNNNTLIMRPLNGKSTWNGKEILPVGELPSAFVNDQVSAFYHADAELVKDGTRGLGVDIVLPAGVTLTVNRWKISLAAKITMCSQAKLPGGQGGQCGNYNGDPADDLAKAERAPAKRDFWEAASRTAPIKK
eukprot:TRINITY_DN726_c0_g1_i2.p1 TRINITY_DN726_c0_g1~~TRINITY_DN726_c0_g1_i2.p1  ORF type:complete len:869 (+),score=195.53 TRINITY_DN726_c0_g1_i2:67-2607(+)